VPFAEVVREQIGRRDDVDAVAEQLSAERLLGALGGDDRLLAHQHPPTVRLQMQRPLLWTTPEVPRHPQRATLPSGDPHVVARVPNVTQAASSTTPSGLRVHVAERTDVLVAALANVLATTPADAFTPDVVAVPTRGVERWVAQRLSHRLGTTEGTDGICANVLFPSPHRLVSDALATTSADDDPWSQDELAWHVLAAIDAHHGADWFRTVSRYLGDEQDEVRRGRRFRLAHRVARLFSTYDVQRPQMLRAWAVGRDEDGLGVPLPDDLLWQPRLWREVRDAVVEPSPA